MGNKAFALTGRIFITPYNPVRCPGLGASALSGRIAEINLRLFEINLRLFEINLRLFEINLRLFEINLRLFEINLRLFEINHYRPLSGDNIFSRFPRQPHNRPSRGWRSSAWCTAGRGCSQPLHPGYNRALAP